jgi:sugar (pentulose or hexulose) kinase
MEILALDVGSCVVKAAVVDAEAAQPLSPIARVAFELRRPTPETAEIVAEELWSAVAAAARQASRDFPGVAGVGLSVVTPWLVLLDKAGQPLGPIWTHLDRRARPAARQAWAAAGEEFLATAGNRPLPGRISVLSYRQRLNDDPYLCHHAHSYLHLNGWLAFRITGEPAFDRGNACCTGLFGTMTDCQWSKRWCEYFEVDQDWLPPVLSGSDTIGTVRAAVAAELGVTAGIPLKIGTADSGCAMLGGGVTATDLLHIMGTTQELVRLVDRPVPSARLLTRLLGVGEAYVQVAHNPVGAVALDWVRQLCFREQSDEEFYGRTVPEAKRRSTRVLLDPPFLDSDSLEIEAHRAAFRDLTLTAGRLDLLAAVVQAMAQRHDEAVRALGGSRAWRRILLIGGGRDAEIVRQLLPEYAAATVERLEEGALRGVARLFAPRGPAGRG